MIERTKTFDTRNSFEATLEQPKRLNKKYDQKVKNFFARFDIFGSRISDRINF